MRGRTAGQYEREGYAVLGSMGLRTGTLHRDARERDISPLSRGGGCLDSRFRLVTTRELSEVNNIRKIALRRRLFSFVAFLAACALIAGTFVVSHAAIASANETGTTQDSSADISSDANATTQSDTDAAADGSDDADGTGDTGDTDSTDGTGTASGDVASGGGDAATQTNGTANAFGDSVVGPFDTAQADADAMAEDVDAGIAAFADDAAADDALASVPSAQDEEAWSLYYGVKSMAGPVVIAGYNSLNIMTCEQKTVSGTTTGFAGEQNVTPNESTAYWQFVRTDNNTNTRYLLQCIAEGDNYGKYLAASGKSLSLTDDASSAITLTLSSDSKTYVYLRYTSGSTTYYVNTLSNDVAKSEGFSGWNGSGGGSRLKIYKADTSVKDTVSPASARINLFDYWSSPSRYYTDEATGVTSFYPDIGSKANNSTSYNTAINKDSALKFWSKDTKWNGLSHGTANGSGLVQNIVQRTLSNGWPQLNASKDFGSFQSNVETRGSLDYLFDPTEKSDGKASFSDVQGLLSINADGYYEYNSKERFATFLEDENRFEVMDWPVSCASSGDGQFFPFNTAQDVEAAGASSSKCYSPLLNHYFGMSVTTRFIQKYNGYTDGTQQSPVTFQFSGDDDVWIFIDDVLVADIGGIHAAASIKIDFATGKITTSYSGSSQSTTLKAAFTSAGMADTREWSGNTFATDTTHTLKFYYMERGNNESNMWLKYNLVEIPSTAIYKVDQYGQAIPGAVFATYETNGETDENGQYYYKYEDGALEDGATYAIWPSDAYVDTGTGNVYADETKATLLISATYRGVTDDRGEMVFEDPYGSLYSATELKGMLGQHFILREIDVPDGYRAVGSEALLRFAGDILLSDDPYRTGIWSSPSALVTATSTLWRVPHNGEFADDPSSAKVDYYTPGDTSANGTLFAVILKRDGAALKDLDDMNSWDRIYGSEVEGYHVVPINGDGNGTQAAINTAICQTGGTVTGLCTDGQKYGDAEFAYSSSGMQLLIEGMPGDPTMYYTYVESQFTGATVNGSEVSGSAQIRAVIEDCASQAGDYSDFTYASCSTSYATQEQLELLDNMEYMVAYFWTEGDLSNAELANTWRVRSHEGTVTTEAYGGFDVQWGSTIAVPNVENRLIFQNATYRSAQTLTDGQEANDLYNGSGFGLYAVDELTVDNEPLLYYIGPEVTVTYKGVEYTSNRYYLAPDTNEDAVADGKAWLVDENGKKISKTGTYRFSQVTDRSIEDAGDITITVRDDETSETVTISPVRNADNLLLIKPTVTAGTGDNYLTEEGANSFRKIPEGKYVLRQTTAPVLTDANGNKTYYAINPENVRVDVHSRAVYADAGDEMNGVLVGNGPGYLVKTLSNFATQGVVDESLTWISSLLKVNEALSYAQFEEDVESGEFGQYAADSVSEGTASTVAGISSGVTNNMQEAMVTYLTYEPDNPLSIFDYLPTDKQGARCIAANDGGMYIADGASCADGDTVASSEGENMMRLYTDQGWGSLALYQDTAYGLKYTEDTTAYDNLGTTEITALFSNSTYVKVLNEPMVYPDIVKVEEGTEVKEDFTEDDGTQGYTVTGYSVTLEGARFVIAKGDPDNLDEDGQPLGYLYLTYDAVNDAYGWSSDMDDAAAFVSDDDGDLQLVTGTDGNEATAAFSAELWLELMDAGTFYLKETKEPTGYQPISSLITVVMDGARLADAGGHKFPTRFSDDALTLWVENKPLAGFPNIVYVEKGTEVREDGTTTSYGTELSGATFTICRGARYSGGVNVAALMTASDDHDDDDDEDAGLVAFGGGTECWVYDEDTEKWDWGNEDLATPVNLSTLTRDDWAAIVGTKSDGSYDFLGYDYTLTSKSVATGDSAKSYMLVPNETFHVLIGDSFIWVTEGASLADSETSNGLRLSSDSGTLWIEYTPGYVLPSTGGATMPWWAWIAAFCILLAAAIAIGETQRKRVQ